MAQADETVRVLVVDDDEGMVGTLRDILDACGYEVDVAFSGSEAMKLVRQRQPDSILMDIRMPGLNGVEAFRELKRLSPGSFVIFMTAYAASHLVEEARTEGAIEVLSKPLDLARALTLIEETAAKTPVLVVDDDPAYRRSLGDLLAAHGFDVCLAPNIERAQEIFEREPRRVVLLDMKLEGRNGLELMRRVRKVNPRAIVILMTGFSDLQGRWKKASA